MIDEPTASAEQQVTEPEPKPAGGLRAFARTTVGRIVIAVVGLSLVGAILAVVAVVLLSFLGERDAQDAAPQAPVEIPAGAPEGSADGTRPVKAKEATMVPPPVPNSEVYAFRDVFSPLLTRYEPPTTEADTATPVFVQGTLYLIDIVTEDGIRKAVLLWNDVRYTLPAGGTIPKSPWLVVEVGDGSVVMLYGDTPITLYVGQGMAGK